MSDPTDGAKSSIASTLQSSSSGSSKKSGMLDLTDIFSASNPVFSGGFGLAVIAGGAQMLRFGSQVAVKYIRRTCLVTLEVTSKDKSYPWVLQWLYARGAKTQHLSVETNLIPTTTSSLYTKFNFVPGPGQHLFNYNGKFMLISRVREQQMVDLNTGKPWEKIEFMAIGKDTEVFQSILNESHELAMRKEENKTIIMTNWGSEWRQFGQPRKKRSLDSVILDENLAEKLLADVNEWIGAASWYYDRGIPYRRGYILYGPPGSGKSSFIMALAGQLGYNICILNLSERGLTDERLALALSNVPPYSIILLEDIDAAFPTREIDDDYGNNDASSVNKQQPFGVSNVNNNGSASDVTFSGLLNCLDGVSSSEERLVFMTTNHMNRLDPALIRPGRVDYVQILDNASDFQIKKLYRRFYEAEEECAADAFVDRLREVRPVISMAALQGHLLMYKSSSGDAVANIARLAAGAGNNHYNYGMHGDSSLNAKKPTVARSAAKTYRSARTISASEVDRMVFNPQSDWDKDIKG